MDEISLLEELQANIAKRLIRLRQNQTENDDLLRGEDNKGWNVPRWVSRLYNHTLRFLGGCSQVVVVRRMVL